MPEARSHNLLELREALEASWDELTSYRGVSRVGNPALGQCYPTSRVIQYFFPETEIIKGVVWTGGQEEIHFWNGLTVKGKIFHIDLSWQQFPSGSSVRSFKILDRNDLGDGDDTIRRCDLLKSRVIAYLEP